MSKKKLILTSTAIIGIATTIILSTKKKNPNSKLSNYKKLIADGLKDFLEVCELNLRCDRKGEVIRISWDSDSSENYTLAISKHKINKIDLLNPGDVKDQDIKIIEVGEALNYDFDVEDFYCRLKSSNGRLSNLCKFSKAIDLKRSEISAWVVKLDKSYYLHLKEIQIENCDYYICLYKDMGKCSKIKIPKFEDFILFKVGQLNSCLCYVSVKTPNDRTLDKFITWIGEEKYFVSD